MPEPTESIRILLVDDHALFRESIARMLSRELDFDVVADCASVEDALLILRQQPVDLILLDFDLGQRNGMDFMRLARVENITAKVLVVTAGVEPAEAAELIRSGISGIFLKRDSPASLAQSIRDVMAGKVSFEEEVFQQAMADNAAASAGLRAEAFTPRERQVLSGVFEGLANKEIASRLSVSESSVKATLQQLFAKTGVRTRSQLVRIALERYKHEL
jgi:two-component system, NarL family, nitrate/nitrite response regulator NarL